MTNPVLFPDLPYDETEARKYCVAWDSAAEAHGVVIGSPGYVREGREVLGFDRPAGPSRLASTRCESGKRNYCTCDTCF